MHNSHSIDAATFRAGKVRTICVGICILVATYLAALPLSTMSVSPAIDKPAKNTQSTSATSNDPNIVTGGMTTTLARLKENLGAAVTSASNGLRSVEMGVVRGAQFVVASGQTGAQVTKQGATTIGDGLINSLSFIARAPSSVASILVSSVAKLQLPSVDAIVTPAAAGQASLPVITAAPAASPVGSALPSLAAISDPSPADNGQVLWPIKGQITTRFGVPHWPYQPVHTGIDISDGQRPGVTPIKPFRPGRVTEVIHSNLGLGNHVVVDHGQGLTSVYAHLHTITVQVGQQVGNQTQLGTEGSTGASTGTHLHFEIRQYGQAIDPHQHIGSHP